MKKIFYFGLSIWQPLWAAVCCFVGGEFLWEGILQDNTFCLAFAGIMYLASVMCFKPVKDVTPYMTLISFLMAVVSGLAGTLKAFGPVTNWNMQVSEIAAIGATVFTVIVTCYMNGKMKDVSKETAIALLATTVGKLNYGGLSKEITLLGIKPFNIILKTIFKKIAKGMMNIKTTIKKMKRAWKNRPCNYKIHVVWVEIENLTKKNYFNPLQNYIVNAKRQPYYRYGCLSFYYSLTTLKYPLLPHVGHNNFLLVGVCPAKKYSPNGALKVPPQ